MTYKSLFIYPEFRYFIYFIYFISTNLNAETDPGNLMKASENITINFSEDIDEGVMYYRIERENSDEETDMFNVIVVDRNKPYRLRPIVDFSKNKSDKGRFRTHSVFNHIKNKKSIVIAAINGDFFSHDDGSKDYKENKLSFPVRTFIYSGIDMKVFASKPEAMLTFSNDYEKLGVAQIFHKVETLEPEGNVKKIHDFKTQYEKFIGVKSYKDSKTSYVKNLKFSDLGKTKDKNSLINWTIGLTQGSVFGSFYKDGKWVTDACNNPDGVPGNKTFFSSGEKKVPIIAFNSEYLILAVSTTKIKKNRHVCEFLKKLKMSYSTYLDGGGSTQMVVKLRDYFGDTAEHEDVSPNYNNRAVLSAIALVKSYSDIDYLSEDYKRAIYYLTDFGVFSGSNGKFEPKKKITRAELSKVIVKLLNIMQIPKEKRCERYSKYVDSGKNNKPTWFLKNYGEIIICKGILNGDTTNYDLRLNDSISYIELSKMIVVAFVGRDIKTPEKKLVDWSVKYFDCLNNYKTGYKNRFGDEFNIFDLYDSHSWTQETIQQTIQEKSHIVKREDMALFLYRVFTLWQEGKFDKSSSCVNSKEGG